MTTSSPGHHQEAKVALTTTAKLQDLRANNREIRTFVESCDDREMQRPWNDKSEAQQLPHELHEILRRFMMLSFQVPLGSLRANECLSVSILDTTGIVV